MYDGEVSHHSLFDAHTNIDKHPEIIRCEIEAKFCGLAKGVKSTAEGDIKPHPTDTGHIDFLVEDD